MNTQITPALISAVYEQPWSIDSGAWRSIHSFVQSPLSISIADMFQSRKPMQIDDNGIAHVSLSGTLGNHPPIAGLLGDTDYSLVTSELLEANEHSRGVMLHVNTPGGQSAGNIESAQVFSNMDVPTVAHCQGMACSAGYAYTVGADKIVTEPSALVGSIGVIIPRLDISEAMERQGVKADYITSGDLKGAGMAGPLTPDQRGAMQEIVDDLFSEFKSHVLDHRSIADDSMRGQAVVGRRAVANNLADAVGSQESAYADLLEMIG